MTDWKNLMIFIIVFFVMLTISVIGILKTVENVSLALRPQNSMILWEDGTCNVYGDNLDYALLCVMLHQNVSWSYEFNGENKGKVET